MNNINVEKIIYKKFIVPFYQRGYRWSRNDVAVLVDDIIAADYDYFLQPLIVKPRVDIDPDTFDLVDGQQRLTTVNLILESLNLEKKITINYERNKDENEKENEIDELFKNDVKEYLKTVDKKRMDILRKKIDNVFFIWYEIPTNDSRSAEEVFNDINDGIIPLTNAELIKAEFVKNFSESIENKINEQLSLENNNISIENSSLLSNALKICYMQNHTDFISKWFDIEYSLRNDEFWGFIVGKNVRAFSVEYSATRIDYLFFLLSGLKESSGSRLGIYEELKLNYLKNGKLDLESLWKKLNECYSFFYECYNEDRLFHYVGAAIGLGYKDFDYNSSKLDVLRKCISFIKEKDFGNRIYKLQKGSNDASIREVLFLHNVFSEYQAGRRFSFYKFFTTQYDIEHIDSSTPNESVELWKTALLNAVLINKDEESKKREVNFDEAARKFIFKEIDGIKAIGIDVFNKDDLDRLNDKQLLEYLKNKFYKETPYEIKNSLQNLVLLDRSTNREYQNALFCKKRQIILNKYRDNKVYIPFCTINAFMKAYSNYIDNPLVWSVEEDGIAYMTNISTVLEKALE